MGIEYLKLPVLHVEDDPQLDEVIVKASGWLQESKIHLVSTVGERSDEVLVDLGADGASEYLNDTSDELLDYLILGMTLREEMFNLGVSFLHDIL
jgi:hypothetical protein